MASTITATATVGGHFHVTCAHPNGKVYVPRFRNIALTGYADLPTYQAACQVAATALVDQVLPRGPNATAMIATLR